MTKGYLLPFAFLIFFSAITEASEKAKTGFKLTVKVSGFFSPEVTMATVKSVEESSEAESQGVEVGDQLLSIDGCSIPGCPASQAKQSLSQPAGQKVKFVFRKSNGTEYPAEVILY